VKYFRLQNYWTQQAGLFSMSAKKAMLENPELDYNLQYSHYNTVKNQLAADYAEQRKLSPPRTALRRDVLLPGPGSDRWPAGPGD
jgi:hypothetical protein